MSLIKFNCVTHWGITSDLTRTEVVYVNSNSGFIITKCIRSDRTMYPEKAASSINVLGYGNYNIDMPFEEFVSYIDSQISNRPKNIRIGSGGNV